MGWPRTAVASGAASAVSDASNNRHRGLRAGLAALALILMAPAGAVAADMPDFLRGSYSPSSTRWDGFYFGGQAGWSSATVNYSNSLSPLTGYILRDSVLESDVTGLQTMGRESPNHNNYGAFLGYNFQLADQLVLGVEANYTHLGLESSAADTIERIFNNDTGAPSGHHYYYDTTVTGSASVRIRDFATVRARAGYEMGQFLPYAFGGLAIGRVDYFSSATVGYTTQDKPDPATPPTTPDPPPSVSPVSKTDAQSNSIAYGFAAGLGVDVSILPNVFLRAEWEYVQFTPIHDIQVGVNSGRVGIGVKF